MTDFFTIYPTNITWMMSLMFDKIVVYKLNHINLQTKYAYCLLTYGVLSAMKKEYFHTYVSTKNFLGFTLLYMSMLVFLGYSLWIKILPHKPIMKRNIFPYGHLIISLHIIRWEKTRCMSLIYIGQQNMPKGLAIFLEWLVLMLMKTIV